MPTKRFDFAYTETPLVELPTPLQKLAEDALKSTTLSYAPFSGLHVGCSAERVALYNASTLHPKAKIVALAIAAKSGDSPTEDPISPCGACRQVLAEYAARQASPIGVVMVGQSRTVWVHDACYLLPFTFKL